MEGTHSMVYKIAEELPNAQHQLSTAIPIVLADYSEARQLCHEILTQSHLKLQQGIFGMPTAPPSSVHNTYGPH
eukprot:5545640-Ditylum_brightwellii.AAC.1